MTAALTLPLLAIAGCSSSPSDSADSASPSGTGSDSCPTDPIKVVASVNQWGILASQLGGACADVTSIITGTDVEPHDYEPTTADISKFSDAKVVIYNGMDYDPWAADAASNAADATVVDVQQINGVEDGENPHLWYSPEYSTKAGDEIASALETASPDAKDYFEQRKTDWEQARQDVESKQADLKTQADGKTYAATESVADYLAQAVGLVDKTPTGYANASANESEPSASDIDQYVKALEGKQVDVLLYNIQEESSTTQRLKEAATSADIPVIEVTEQIPSEYTSFTDWQSSVVDSFAKALSD